MPSKTFFGLEQEKQDRILAVAINQFSTNKFSDISINEIIKEAGIPRGSFYQYFLSKEDLFFFLAQKRQDDLLEKWKKQIRSSGGDLFVAFEEFANKEIEWVIAPADQMFFRNMFVFMGDYRQSKWYKTDGAEPEMIHKHNHDFGLELIDRSKLKVDSDDELMLLFQIMVGLLVQIARTKLVETENNQDEKFRLRVKLLISWLQNGVLKGENK